MTRILGFTGSVVLLAMLFALLGLDGGPALLLAMLLAGYGLPAIVACTRQHPKRDGVIMLNLLLGWTVLGWTLGMVWAVSAPLPSTPAAPSR